MLNDERSIVLANNQEEDEGIRDIHAVTPARPRSTNNRPWETSSHISTASSEGGVPSENFTSMSREFNALVLAGSTIPNNSSTTEIEGTNNLARIGEEENNSSNHLAIVADNTSGTGEVSADRVKKEEVESKISAWQTAKISKINNRFKREDAVISGWESEEVQKATSSMKKVERKLEEKRVKALEKMENEIANARRKAEEKRASAEAKRGTKVARVVELANLMRVVGRPPSKRSFF